MKKKKKKKLFEKLHQRSASICCAPRVWVVANLFLEKKMKTLTKEERERKDKEREGIKREKRERRRWFRPEELTME